MAACLAQNAEGFRKRALEGVRVITYLQEFASAGSLSQLSDLFQDDNRLAEAAVQPCPSQPKRPAQQQYLRHWQTVFLGRSLLLIFGRRSELACVQRKVGAAAGSGRSLPCNREC